MHGHRGCSRCVALSLTGFIATRGEIKSQDALNSDFITRAVAFHGDRYGYERTVYTGTADRIEIFCRRHGAFRQIAENHLRGSGCPDCSRIETYADSFKQKCLDLGVDYYRALKRREAGMSEDQIFEREKLRHLRRINPVSVDGHDYPNLGAAVRHIRPPATATTIARWLASGMAPEEAFRRVPNPGVKNGMIYLITHIETGKKYIGLTVQSIERRWVYHQQQARAGWIKSLEGLHAAIREFGPDGFVVEAIDGGETKIDLETKERAWIKKHYSLVPAGFNISTGGGSGGVGAKPLTLDGIRFASIRLAVAHLSETREISFEAAKARLLKGRTDVRKPAAKGESKVGTSAYKAWSRIRHGVMNPNSKEFIEGVTLCPAWHDPRTFIDDVGQPPDGGMAFVRLDKTLGYFPENCRWMRRSEAGKARCKTSIFKESERRLTRP
ncbi:GIY-YIG nuclease family protein [Rhizobium sp. CFBP 8752]|uniref:GIY-YIG nuclease family protein n=1 Tax=Rhizobium sp. CFBP 8752 TaxID=2775301 RepID=UPI0017870770|nr:GIY-YIG nuclease family protein [Rhizobium sp. CFBP 8752]MBD8665726.1 GIY-YIG nuclease family protein [Rhizobium sp. CFBP 8752]